MESTGPGDQTPIFGPQGGMDGGSEGSGRAGHQQYRYRSTDLKGFSIATGNQQVLGMGPRTHKHTFGPVAISLAKEVPQRATAGHSTQQPYGRPENGHRSVTYQQFVGPASVVMKSGQKGSWDL